MNTRSYVSLSIAYVLFGIILICSHNYGMLLLIVIVWISFALVAEIKNVRKKAI